MKLQSQITLVFALFGLLPLLAVGYAAYHFSRGRLADQADQNLLALAHRVASEVNSYAYGTLEAGRTDALIPNFDMFLEATPERRARLEPSVRQLLFRSVENDPVNATSAALFDASGAKVADSAPKRMPIDETGAPWIRDTLAAGLPTLTTYLDGPSAPAIMVCAPVHDPKGKLVGLLRVRYELTALQQIIGQLSSSTDRRYFALVLDGNSRVLADGLHSDRVTQRLELPPVGTEGRPPDGDGGRLVRMRWSAEAAGGGAPDTVAIEPLPRAPWRVAVGTTDSVQAASVAALRQVMLFLGAVVVIFGGVAAYVAGRRLSEPIQTLAHTAQRIGRGELGATLEAGGADEVRLLAQSVNQMTQALRSAVTDRERRLHDVRRILENSPVAMALIDSRLDFTYFNPRFQEVFGYAPADLPNADAWWTRAYPDPAYREKIIATWRRLVLAAHESGRVEAEPFEAMVTCKDGSVRDVEFRSISMGADRLVVFTDLTAHKRAERTLRESEERFRLLIENSNELVLLVRADGHVLYASPNHRTLLGFTAAEVAGEGFLAHVHPEDLEGVRRGLLSPSVTRAFRFQARDGTWRILESSGRSFTLQSGEVQGVVISRDVTARVEAERARDQLEAQLRQSQKLEAIGSLAGGIAHDFNNILTSIMGNTQLADMILPDGHSAKEHLAQAMTASARARDLITQILAFSRRTENQRSPILLSQCARDTVRMLRPMLPATIEIVTELRDNVPAVLADSTQIVQVILNLATNAAQAMEPDGGRLEILLDDLEVDDDMVRQKPQLRPGLFVRLRINDTGCGMDAATRERIFEPFFTTKEPGKGTGLGLAVVHGIMEQHEGAIVVYSAPGKGSSFQLYFPAVAGPRTAPPFVPSAATLGHGQRLLVVDDEQMVLGVAEKVLRRSGYEVQVFNDPQVALNAFRANPDGFDLLVTDLTMPGMKGTALAAEVRRLRPALPVLISTGFAGGLDSGSARQLGLFGPLLKPFSVETLLSAVNEALSSTRA